MMAVPTVDMLYMSHLLIKKVVKVVPSIEKFVYDTQKPEITAADPIDLSQPVSYISESLTQLQFTLQDVGPAGHYAC